MVRVVRVRGSKYFISPSKATKAQRTVLLRELRELEDQCKELDETNPFLVVLKKRIVALTAKLAV